jgi:hypothetical protein
MKFYLPKKAKKTQVMLLILLISLISGCTSLKLCAYEGFKRDSWQQPDQVIRALDIQQRAGIDTPS